MSPGERGSEKMEEKRSGSPGQESMKWREGDRDRQTGRWKPDRRSPKQNHMLGVHRHPQKPVRRIRVSVRTEHISRARERKACGG